MNRQQAKYLLNIRFGKLGECKSFSDEELYMLYHYVKYDKVCFEWNEL